ncbi:MAG: hypothetical protein B1H08_04635 [Candidatus Omnitrophica bacterium 4484_171]|nr:MAG: hypothetical protein B1H08_04635 [Candidatus Omnitrophica bacterium 4484_171]
MEYMDISIRRYTREDRDGLRRIAWRTAFLKESPENFLDDRKTIEDVLTIYFTDYEPGSSFVAIYNNKVVGYIIGALNVKILRAVLVKKIIPRLIIGAFRRKLFLKISLLRFLSHTALSLLKREFFVPDFSGEYPATFHINIDEQFRGHGLGAKMVEHYLEFLKTKMIKGVHVGTMSERGRNFFSKLGFSLLFRGKRSHLKYILKRDVPYYVLGRALQMENT